MRTGWIEPRRVVVKVGSAVIAPEGRLDAASVQRLCDDVSGVLGNDRNRQVIIVSSGAVASGYQELKRDAPPRDIVGKQAAAAIGQPRLMRAYAEAFAKSRRSVAQVLLTADDIDHRERFLNARGTLSALLDAGVVPVINENDSVSFNEIKLGDNDHLSAMVAGLVGADLLVILSTVAGVWDIDGPASAKSARIVPTLASLAEAMRHVRPGKSGVGTGGMVTKVRAACTAAALGTSAVIADGTREGVVDSVVRGAIIGTYFPTKRGARADVAAHRKKWIGLSARPKGVLVIDDGARKALVERRASLLPGGVRGVNGEFGIGELVEVRDSAGVPVARGLSAYSAAELRVIKGMKSAQIESALGYRTRDEVVHRSDLMLLNEDHPARVGAADRALKHIKGERP